MLLLKFRLQQKNEKFSTKKKNVLTFFSSKNIFCYHQIHHNFNLTRDLVQVKKHEKREKNQKKFDLRLKKEI